MYVNFKSGSDEKYLFISHEQGSAIKMEPVGGKDFYCFSLDFSIFVTVMSCAKRFQTKPSGIHISVCTDRCKK